jgi:hypothetical protein
MLTQMVRHRYAQLIRHRSAYWKESTANAGDTTVSHGTKGEFLDALVLDHL